VKQAHVDAMPDGPQLWSTNAKTVSGRTDDSIDERGRQPKLWRDLAMGIPEHRRHALETGERRRGDRVHRGHVCEDQVHLARSSELADRAQQRAKLSEPDFASSYQGALAAGDADAIVGMFEPDGYAREPAGINYVHRGPDGLREFYESLFSNGGGIPLEHCSVIQNERACALEYNVVRWGTTELLPPEAGIAVYVRGEGGKLAAARIYDDVDPQIDSLG
jgi:hypothetical protein